jgi:hypothetical protein
MKMIQQLAIKEILLVGVVHLGNEAIKADLRIYTGMLDALGILGNMLSTLKATFLDVFFKMRQDSFRKLEDLALCMRDVNTLDAHQCTPTHTHTHTHTHRCKYTQIFKVREHTYNSCTRHMMYTYSFYPRQSSCAREPSCLCGPEMLWHPGRAPTVVGRYIKFTTRGNEKHSATKVISAK